MFYLDPPDDGPDPNDAEPDDEERIEYCVYCAQSYLSGDYDPYCSWICAIDAEEENAMDKENQP